MIVVLFNIEVDLSCQDLELKSSEEEGTYSHYDPNNLCSSVLLQKGQVITATCFTYDLPFNQGNGDIMMILSRAGRLQHFAGYEGSSNTDQEIK